MIRSAARAALAALALLAAPAGALTLQETPMLAEKVAAGTLPPVAERLPAEPLVVDLPARGRELGRHGGTLRTFITRPRDIRYMVVWGYARLVGYDEQYRLKPDILRDVTVEDNRVFTFHLRRGHRWSDGHPFTTEDFRYWWEDVAQNPDLSPGGVPEFMLADGRPPVVTVIDEVTIRYEWPVPNPRFLVTLAAARDPFIYRPAHYTRQFHARYADEAALKPLIAEMRARSWAQLHNARDNMYDFDNPALPTLQPWVTISDKNAAGYDLVRNPFFHRVDTAGRQLPYIDRVELTIAAGGLIPQKVALGEADLQVRTLTFADAPVLKQGERKGGYLTFLWSNGAGSEIALYPNQNYEDEAFRALFRDVRFRRALSLGINRRIINKTLYFGLAQEAAVAPLKGSPFYDPALSTSWAQHDPKAANALLDALGLTARDGDGTRRLPDGRRLEIVVETAGERPEESDALELVAEMWAEIGVRMVFRPLDRDILRNKVYAGESMMPVWTGWNNGLPTPEAQRLLALFLDWQAAPDEAARASVWREMLAIHADQVFAIGLVSAAPQPLIASVRLRNVPKAAVYAWEPGAHLGVHRMDEFFFAD